MPAIRVTAFLQSLYMMTNENPEQNCISWNEEKDTFWVNNVDQFTKTVLPIFFRHNNYASFVRRLNMYGFRRSTRLGRVRVGEAMIEVFCHPSFLFGRDDLLPRIKRTGCGRNSSDRAGSTTPEAHRSGSSGGASAACAAGSPSGDECQDAEHAKLLERVDQAERTIGRLEGVISQFTQSISQLTSQLNSQSYLLSSLTGGIPPVYLMQQLQQYQQMQQMQQQQQHSPVQVCQQQQ